MSLRHTLTVDRSDRTERIQHKHFIPNGESRIARWERQHVYVSFGLFSVRSDSMLLSRNTQALTASIPPQLAPSVVCASSDTKDYNSCTQDRTTRP